MAVQLAVQFAEVGVVLRSEGDLALRHGVQLAEVLDAQRRLLRMAQLEADLEAAGSPWTPNCARRPPA